MTVIDTHCHYIPESVADALRSRQTAPMIFPGEDGQERRLMPAGNELSFDSEYSDMAARAIFMDETGVDRQVLSMGLLFGLHALPIDEAQPIARLFNNELASLCRRMPDRFSGLALLPLSDISESIAEYRRCRNELGLVGAILPVNYFVDRYEAAAIEPLLEAAHRDGGHIFVHPGVRPDEFANLADANRSTSKRDNLLSRQALDVQAKLANAVVTLTNSDLLDPYPELTVQVANLGGTLPMVIERIDCTVMIRTPDEAVPSQRLNRVYVDCASLGPKSIEMAVAVYGADRVVFGTDCPIFRTDWSLNAIRTADLSDETRRAILGQNAEQMLQQLIPAAA
jgi:predicted TIM-barrel fold metal-dependent hydrolase